MKKSFLVYGTGDFFYQYKSEIQEKFTICAYIDKNAKITNIDNTTVYHSLSEDSGQYDVILVMTESPFILFEILDIIKMNGVSAKKISLGISFYGSLSKYFDFFLCDDYRVQIISENCSCYAENSSVFIRHLQTRMEDICLSMGGMLKDSLTNLYKDKLQVMWMNQDVWCADHDADIYYRFEKQGFFNWGYFAVFSLMAIKQFSNPYVLDLGCGDAYYFSRFYKYVRGIKYMGCDIHLSLIKQARQKNRDEADKCDFVVADMVDSMPQPRRRRYFDVILWNGSFSVFDDNSQDRIVEKAKLRCGRDGILVVSDYYGKEKSPWIYSRNVTGKKRLYDLFRKYFAHMFLHIDESSQGFYLLATNGKLPMYNFPFVD